MPRPKKIEKESLESVGDHSLDQSLYNKPGFLVRLLHQTSAAIFVDEFLSFGITPVQYGALAAIRANPGIDQISVAVAIGFDRNTICGVIERLEIKGLIVRSVSKSDRRSRSLELTPAGAELLEIMQPAAENVQERLLAPLQPKDRETFLHLLGQLVRDHLDITGKSLRLTREGSAKLTRLRAVGDQSKEKRG